MLCGLFGDGRKGADVAGSDEQPSGGGSGGAAGPAQAPLAAAGQPAADGRHSLGGVSALLVHDLGCAG